MAALLLEATPRPRAGRGEIAKGTRGRLPAARLAGHFHGNWA